MNVDRCIAPAVPDDGRPTLDPTKCRASYIARAGEDCQEIADATDWPPALVFFLNPECRSLVKTTKLCLFVRSQCGVGYVVKQGDTCDSIAASYGIDAAKLKDLNPALQCQSLVPQQQVLCVAGMGPGGSLDELHYNSRSMRGHLNPYASPTVS